MPNFRYNATDAAGKWVSGEAEGATPGDVQDRLKAGGLNVESLIEADDRASSGPLSKSDIVAMVEQLASLTRAGLPLPSGLRAAAEEMISPRLRTTFLGLARAIESGSDLETSLGSIVGRFPADLRGLIVAGSRSGRLTDLLSEFVRGANLAAELRRMFWSTLIYPLITLMLILGVVRLVCEFAVEPVDGILNDFGIDKPGSTQLLAAVTRSIAAHGTALTIALLVGPLAVWGLLRITTGPAKRRALFCGVPLVGPILRYCTLTEFCHRLSMLLEAELPLPEAFELAGSSVDDASVADACLRIGRGVEAGEPLSSAVRVWESIPAGLGQLFRWSEDRRTLPEALHLAGEMFEARARSQASFARSVLSTILVLMILWWVGFAFAALYLPMITLISRLAY